MLEDDPEVVRLLVEYLYILDYEPLVLTPTEEFASHDGSSDTMSTRTDYGHMYGTPAISAFGGPQSPFGQVYRSRTESQLTVHALPSGDFHGSFGRLEPRRRKPSRGMVTAAPEPSPLATKEPNLRLHAKVYAAAHKFGIDGLKALSLDKFKIQLTRHWCVTTVL